MWRVMNDLLGKRSRQQVIPVMILGIGTPSYNIAKQIIEQGRYRIVAFIDEEPWTNRTELLGATVRYPSDMRAMIEKHDIKLLIGVEGDYLPASNLLDDALLTGVRFFSMLKGADVDFNELNALLK